MESHSLQSQDMPPGEAVAECLATNTYTHGSLSVKPPSSNVVLFIYA